MKILNDFMITNLDEFMASKNISVENKPTSWFALAPIIKKRVNELKPTFILSVTSRAEGKDQDLLKYDVSILNPDTKLDNWGTGTQETKLKGKLSDFMKSHKVTSVLDELTVTNRDKTGVVKLCIAESKSKSKEAKLHVKTNYSVGFSNESTQKYLIINAKNTAETFWGTRHLIEHSRQLK